MRISSKEAYAYLGLPYGADEDSVMTSYKRLALQWHPDKHQNSVESLQKFSEISSGYHKLTDQSAKVKDVVTIDLSMVGMYDLFNEIFLSRGYNGYGENGSSGEEQEDYDDDENDGIDYLSIFEDKLKTKPDYKKQVKSDHDSETRKRLTADEIEQNAQELIDEEDKEKKKAEKRKAKKKRQREKKKEKDIEEEQSEHQQNVSSKVPVLTNGDKTSLSMKDRSKTKESDSGDEFDPSAAFFTKVIKKKKTNKIITTDTSNASKQDLKKDIKSNAEVKKKQEDMEVEELDPVVVTSRQLAIRGNEMANLGHHTAAIDLFTEAIHLDCRDFRFFGNRSYCFDRIQQYDRALKDAERAVKLAPDWPKGYFRRGRALAGLKYYSDAEQSFMQVLKLDHNCEDALQELFRVRTHQLIEMGFSRQQADSSIRQHGTVQAALDNLLAGVVADSTLSSEIYVSDNEEFTTLPSRSYKSQNNNTQQKKTTNIAHKNITSLPKQAQAAKECTVNIDLVNLHGSTALWVGNVLPEVSDKQLVQLFSKYGPVSSARILTDKFCAFINFKSAEDASHAMHALQGYNCHGQQLLIKFPDNPISNGGLSTSFVDSNAHMVTTHSHKKAPRHQDEFQPRQSGPVNGDECYFWRTTGCQYGSKCRYKHNPSHKNIDRKPWHHPKE